jgi:hypothetical protein
MAGSANSSTSAVSDVLPFAFTAGLAGVLGHVLVDQVLVERLLVVGVFLTLTLNRGLDEFPAIPCAFAVIHLGSGEFLGILAGFSIGTSRNAIGVGSSDTPLHTPDAVVGELI